MFFFELREGDDDIFSDLIVAREEEMDSEEFFELAIDPYPRAPDAALDNELAFEEPDDSENGDNPFARLAALRDKL